MHCVSHEEFRAISTMVANPAGTNGRVRIMRFWAQTLQRWRKVEELHRQPTRDDNDHSCHCGPCTHLLLGQQNGCVCVTLCYIALSKHLQGLVKCSSIQCLSSDILSKVVTW